MGFTPGSDAGEPVNLCVFDLRRGQTEGQELDKILFFYPKDVSLSTQLSVIGLSEGLITFTRIFSPNAPCEVIEAEMHSHVFYEAEPDIWMVLIVEKHDDSDKIWRMDSLREVLKEVHSLFVMFNGSIRVLVDKEPTGGLVRTHLYLFIMDFLKDFSAGKKLHLPNFHDSLKERGTFQMLTMGREAALEVESLVRVIESCAGDTKCFTMVLFQDLVVSSNLSPVDSVNLFVYATLRLTPHALSAASSWSYSHRGSAGPFIENSDVHDVSSLRNGSYSVLRPLQRGKWFKGEDGFLLTDIWGLDVNSSAPKSPVMWLNQTEEKMYMLAFQHRGLTAIVLIPVSSVVGEQGISRVKQRILETASVKISKVEEKLSRAWGGENAYHVSGYRYLLVDGDTCVSRATPPGKVTTLTKESLVAMNKLREEVDLEKSGAKWNSSSSFCENNLEMCLRARNNAWLIARLTGGKELYMVLEKANETLLYASEAVEKFSERYCDGTFH